MGRLRTFSQHHGHLRVDGDRHPKSRPLSSALRGMKALLGLVELNVHLPLRITGTAAPGRRALRRSPEVTGGRGGQEASSCEQPVDGARAGDSAPFAAMSRWKAAHEQGRPSQPTPFSRNSSFLSGSYNSTRAGAVGSSEEGSRVVGERCAPTGLYRRITIQLGLFNTRLR